MTSWKFNVGIWLSLFLLALIFAWERTLYADSSFVFFNVLNQFPAIEHHRFTQILNIFPAQLLVLLNLPIKFIAAALSVTPLIWGFLASAYSTAKRQNPYWNFYFLGIFLVTGPEFQFLGTAEMILALIFTGLFALESQKPLIFIWSLLAYLAHPGILPALLILAAFKGRFHLIFTISVVLLKVILLPGSAYESQILSKLFNFSSLFESWGWHYFYTSLFGGWALPYLVVFLGGMVVFSGTQRWKYIVTSVLAALFISHLYQDGDSGMMMQKSYAPLWPILAFPFFLKKDHQTWVSPLLIFTFFWGFYHIALQSQFHKQRKFRLHQKLESLQSTNLKSYKILTSTDSFPPENYGIAWAIPYESLIYSTHLNAKRPITYCLTDSAGIENFKSPLENKKPLGINEFRGASFAFPLKNDHLNQRYFSSLSKDAYRID